MKDITASEFKQRVDDNKEVFLIDVRPIDVFNSWHITEYNKLKIINIPLDDIENSMEKIPKDKQIYVICNRGNSSRIASSILTDGGYNVTNISGGMKEWSSLYNVKEIEQGLYQFNRVGKGCLSYLIVSGKEAIVVDPSIHIDQYIKLSNDLDSKIKYVIDTHLHADHISGARDISNKTGCKYLGPREDFSEQENMVALDDVPEIVLGKKTINTIKTPGHTNGMTSIFVDKKYLLTGDALFVKSVGRPDLGGEEMSLAPEQYNSILNIKKLGDSIIILPGHMSDNSEINEYGYVGSIVSKLKQVNKLFSIDNRDLFIKMMLENMPSQPNNYIKIKDINKTGKNVVFEEIQKIEFGPNNCASTK